MGHRQWSKRYKLEGFERGPPTTVYCLEKRKRLQKIFIKNNGRRRIDPRLQVNPSFSCVLTTDQIILYTTVKIISKILLKKNSEKTDLKYLFCQTDKRFHTAFDLTSLEKTFPKELFQFPAFSI